MVKRFLIIIALYLSVVSLLPGQGFSEYMATNSNQSFAEITAHLDAYYSTHDQGKGSGYKQYMRWYDWTIGHLMPDGTIANQLAMNTNAYTSYRKQHPNLFDRDRETHGGWSQEGPTEVSVFSGSSSGIGRVNRITPHPNDSSTLYACTAGGGIWVTTNLGNSWVPLTNDIPVSATGGLVIDPTNDQIMYLLTGDCDSGNTASMGVLKSTDGGMTWDYSGLVWDYQSGTRVRGTKILMHPTNSNILFVSSSIGLFKTTNSGATWVKVSTEYFFDFEFNPADPSMMYAVTINKFFKSTNSGNSFAIQEDEDFPSQLKRIEIGVTPADSSLVYLLFGGHDTVSGVYKGVFLSEDFGEDFTLQSNSPNILGWEVLGDDQGNQADYDLSLAVDNFDPDIIYIGGINNWRSLDRGVTWELLTYWAEYYAWPFVHADVHQLLAQGTKLWVATDGGVYSLETTTGVWDELSPGMCIMQPYNIDVLNDGILLGSQDNGSMRWQLGETIATAEFGGDGFDCMWDPSPPAFSLGSFYISWQDELLITNSDGFNFTSISVDSFGAGQYWFVDLMMHPTNHDTIYVGVGRGNSSSDVFRSYNRGGTWTDMNCGLGWETSALAISPSNPDIVFASTRSNVVRTNNIHASTPVWTLSDTIPVNNHPDRGISDIIVDPNNPAIVYVCIERYIDGHKVYMSSDTGSTWTNFSGSLPNVPFHCLLHEGGSNGGIYAGSDLGVFYRNNNMNDWIYFGNDLPVTPVVDLDMDNGRLYAGTFGRGVWSSELYSTCINNLTLNSGDPGTGTHVYHTLDYITSTQIIEGGIGTDIQYNSEGFIILETGFHAKAKNLFEAKLESCPD